MKVFFISGVDTNVGKTFLASKLVSTLQNRGIKAIAIKPIETGSEKEPPDSMLHLSQALNIFPSLHLADINFYSFALPAAPSVADTQGIISLEQIFTNIAKLQNDVEILLVEGAGGLFTPICKDYFMLSLAKDLSQRFGAKTILVCDDGLGMINRFLCSQFVLDSLQLESLFFVNIRNQEIFTSINFPFMKNYAFETEIKSLANQLLKG